MKKLLWCPIDIPRFPIDNFMVSTTFNWNFWKVAKLTDSKSSPYDSTEFLEEITSQYPELIEWFNHFPYLSIRNIKFNIQTGPVAAHIDFTRPELNHQLHNNNSINEPCGYRILLRGSRSNKLFVMRNNEKFYVTIPETTDVYVLGHTSVLHGVDDDKDRLTIFTHFEIDSARHQELLKRSLEKYGEYAVFD